MMKKFWKYGLWQKFLAILMILIELGFAIFFIYALVMLSLSSQAVATYIFVFYLMNLVTEVFITFTTSEPDYKIIWMLIVAVIPVFGMVMYMMFANKRVTPRQRRRLVGLLKALHLEASNPDTKERLSAYDMDSKMVSNYIEHATGAGIYENSAVTYYPLGDDCFPEMLKELEKAKHYIFIEYFIINEGKMWDPILAILQKKVLQGVDVRLIYDDMGNLGSLPVHYDLQLKKMGIKAHAFRPIKPFIDVKMNNRDHRKIMVIDGHTAFTGGINLADEYINEKVRFGHWKDNAVKIYGKGVYSLTLMFLSNWKASFEPDFNIDVYYYSPSKFIGEAGGFPHSDGFVQPYGDLPFDKETVGQNVYLSLLGRAHKYLYMTTPYLIIDEEMRNAICKAALQGVDVRLLTPHIPDKWGVFQLTRSSYGPLLDAGVKIYEYTPGFVHMKMFVSDDNKATVGTINLDYRSLYLHMENGVFLTGNSCIVDMRNDFLETLSKSEEITIDKWKSWHKRRILLWMFLRLVAPLL